VRKLNITNKSKEKGRRN